MKNLDISAAFTIHKLGYMTSLRLESRTVPYADKVVRQFLKHVSQHAVRQSLMETNDGSYARSRPTAKGTQTLLYPYTFYMVSVELGRRVKVSDIIHAERMGTIGRLAQNLVIQPVEIIENVETLKSSAQC
jgi:hypothetical protein